MKYLHVKKVIEGYEIGIKSGLDELKENGIVSMGHRLNSEKMIADLDTHKGFVGFDVQQKILAFSRFIRDSDSVLKKVLECGESILTLSGMIQQELALVVGDNDDEDSMRIEAFHSYYIKSIITESESLMVYLGNCIEALELGMPLIANTEDENPDYRLESSKRLYKENLADISSLHDNIYQLIDLCQRRINNLK